MPGDALFQVEGHAGAVITELPIPGECRDDLVLVGDLDQALEDREGGAGDDRSASELRVEPARVTADRLDIHPFGTVPITLAAPGAGGRGIAVAGAGTRTGHREERQRYGRRKGAET